MYVRYKEEDRQSQMAFLTAKDHDPAIRPKDGSTLVLFNLVYAAV